MAICITIMAATPAFGWVWDKNENRIDDRIEEVNASGLAAAYENGDTELGRLIIAVGDADGVLRYGVYVGYEHQPTDSDLQNLSSSGVSTAVFRPYQTIPYVRMNLTFGEIETVASLPNVERVEAIEMMYPVNNVAGKTSGVVDSRFQRFPTVQGNLGFTGSGVVVSILDTGVNDQPDSLTGFPGHEAFTGKFIAGGDFYAGQPAVNTPPDQSINPIDRGPRSQHGTHVAGTAIGTGGPTAVFGGNAPGSLLVDQKVLSDAGAGFGSADGVEWAILNKEKYGIRILNLSLGTLTESDGTDASSRAINAAFDAGLFPIVAAGNDRATNYMPSPAAADKAFTIGAIADQNSLTRQDDLIASYSNEGPRMSDGDADFEDEMKPLVAAPGSGIVSADGMLTTDGRQYKPLSGTSMATPHAAGIVALILEANPSLAPREVWEILKHTSEHRRDWGKTPAGADPFPQGDPNYHPSGGWGQIDAYAAVKEALRLAGDPASQTQVVYIHAEPASDGSAAIDVTWASQREINLAGYDIDRAEDVNGAPGVFERVTAASIPGIGSAIIEQTHNRNGYSFRDTDVEAGKTYWYRIAHTSTDSTVGTIEEPALAVTLGQPRPVARLSYSITHNAIDNDLLVLLGTGPQVERARFVIDGKSALQADTVTVVPGESTTGNRQHDFTIDLTTTHEVESYLPPSKTNPWFLSVKEGGYINRSGRVNSFSLTTFDADGNPTATYETADPTPQETVEGTTTKLWIPDNPDLWVTGDTPTVIETDPSSAERGQELEVSIFGADFSPGATASFGEGIEVNGVEYRSGSWLVATISVSHGAAAGPRDVTVTNMDGISGTRSAAFSVVGEAECTTFTEDIDDSDPAVEYGRGWHFKEDGGASSGGYHRLMARQSDGQSSRVRVVFEGDQVTYFYATSKHGGSADLYIDGVLRDQISYAGTGTQPLFGASRTYADLGEGVHEVVLVPTNAAAFVDGFRIAGCEGGGADASAVESRSATSNSTADMGGLLNSSVVRTVEVSEYDTALSVIVEGASHPLTVNVLGPLGDLLASGESLLEGVSGVVTSVSEPGTYTVQIIDALGGTGAIDISIARTVRVR